MGRHRKPNRVKRQVLVAAPVMALCACLVSTTGHTRNLSLSDVIQRPAPVTLTVDHPDAWYLAKAKAGHRYIPPVVHHRASAPVPQATATTPVPTPTQTQPTPPPVYTGSFNQKVIKAAESQIGVPYIWGGSTPGVGLDCSGLTQYAYSVAGQSIPRIANDQFNYFKMIPQSQARPGDLVFFHESSDLSSYVYHVGIFLGGSDMMVVAPAPGNDVQIQSFDWGGDTVSFGTLDIFS